MTSRLDEAINEITSLKAAYEEARHTESKKDQAINDEMKAMGKHLTTQSDAIRAP
jgi:hypothetical protein